MNIQTYDTARRWLSWSFAIALVGSLCLAPWSDPKHPEFWNHARLSKAAVVALWIILPPIWFWYEYFFMPWDETGRGSQSENLERFKYGQDISSKIWIAVSTALLMLYFGKDIR
jgi:hypothetical protein